MNKLKIIVLFLIAWMNAGAINQPLIKMSFNKKDLAKTIIVEVLDSITRKPVSNISVSLFANRSFGMLPLGDDGVTDSAGTAIIPFNFDIPTYDKDGKIFLTVITEETGKYSEGKNSQSINWGNIIKTSPSGFASRALWSPHAPLPLILTFSILLGGVWIVYGYIIYLLNKIKNDVRDNN